jgi:hypothetical protein
MLVTQAHFGSNIMYTGHSAEPGSALDRFSNWIGATNFRYPGGTVTEEMSHRDGSLDRIFAAPNRGAGINQDVTTLREALDFAAARDGDITFVLPTTTFLTEGAFGTREVDKAALDSFLERVDEMIKGQHGPAVFRTFEIGNEWWLNDTRMTAEEYGKIANEYAKGLKAVFNAHRSQLERPDEWQEPNIAVQSGAYWRGPSSNTTIIQSLDAEAKDAINMVISHFYPRTLAQVQGISRQWGAINEFLNDDDFGDIKVLISEWNISTHSEYKGMQQASLLVETFKTMILKGVDEANIWGTNYKHLSTKLAAMSHNRWEDIDPAAVSLHMMPAGEVYRIMARELVGKQVLDINVEHVILNVDTNNLAELMLVQAFGSPDQITIFISNRGMDPQTFQIQDAFIPDDFTHVWAEYMTAHDNPRTIRDEGDPFSQYARADVSTRNSEQLFDAVGRINLGGYDILKITLTKDGVGVEMHGNDQVIDRALSKDDHLIGGSGDDTIYGSLGNDILEGGGGNDIIFGGYGNDTIVGGSGNDLLIGDSGSNHISADSGTNLLVSGIDSDTLEGGSGNDLFFVMGSSARISGNGGVNLFHFSSKGSYEIADFNATNGDLISFGGRFGSDLEFLTSIHVENQSEDYAGDLVISHENTETSVKLVGQGDLLPFIEDFILDFLPVEDRAEEISNYFSELSPKQLSVFMDHTETEHEFDLFAGISGEDLERNFDYERFRVMRNFLDHEYEHTSEVRGSSTQPVSQGDDPETDDNSISTGHVNEPSTASSGSTALSPNEIWTNPNRASELLADVGMTRNFSSLPEPNSTESESTTEEDQQEDRQQIVDRTCFVATAAYRNPLHPDVVFLRFVRDTVLVNYSLGRIFIAVYWIIGPVLAIPVSRSLLLGNLAVFVLRGIIAVIRWCSYKRVM